MRSVSGINHSWSAPVTPFGQHQDFGTAIFFCRGKKQIRAILTILWKETEPIWAPSATLVADNRRKEFVSFQMRLGPAFWNDKCISRVRDGFEGACVFFPL